MFLRKLMVMLLPFLMCAFLALLFPFLSDTFPELGFFEYVIKGLILGAALSLLIPLMGARRRETFTRLYYIPAVFLFLVLLYQFLHQKEVFKIDILAFMAYVNGQILMVESAFLGFLLTIAIRASRR